MASLLIRCYFYMCVYLDVWLRVCLSVLIRIGGPPNVCVNELKVYTQYILRLLTGHSVRLQKAIALQFSLDTFRFDLSKYMNTMCVRRTASNRSHTHPSARPLQHPQN